MKNRLSSCAAAADILNGRTNSVARRRHQRQRRWCWDDSMTKRKRKSCVNVWYAITSWCNGVARKEVKKPSVSSGSFAHFSSCWEKRVAEGRPRPRGDETPLTLTSDPHTGRPPSLPPRRRLRRWSAGGRTSPVRHRRQTHRHSRSGYPPLPHNSRRQCSPRR